jgi:hypothetical protein
MSVHHRASPAGHYQCLGRCLGSAELRLSLIEISNAGRFECTIVQVSILAGGHLVVMTWRAVPWTLLLLLTWTVADADHVYKWIDQQGEVQYADRPPAKQPERGYRAPVPPSVEERIEQAKLEAWRRRVAEYQKLQAEMQEATVHREAEEEMRQRYCEDAHAHLVYFSYPGRQYVRMGTSGEWTTVETEERAALIEHWQKMVDELCD